MQSERLRLAMVASSLTMGGAEKQTVYMARALVEAGIDGAFFYLGADGCYESALRKTGIPIRQIHVPNRPWTILRRLMIALRKLRPHIVLVSQFGDLLQGGTAGRCCGALTLGGIRSDGLRELDGHGWRGLAMVRLAHGFIANSFRGRQNLIFRGVRPQKVQVLPNVVDLQDFDAQSDLPLSLSLPSKRVIAAAIGRLHPGKRFDRFIEALAVARRQEPTLAGVIAGPDAGAQAALQERASALGLGSQDLIFLGACNRVPALLARAAFLVLSSDYEGFPNVILEAMAARRAVITTPVGDARRIVRHGRTGYVVEGEAPGGMAEFMVRLARSPAMRIDFGEAGRKRVEQEYNYKSLCGRFVHILQNFAERTARIPLLQVLEHTFRNQHGRCRVMQLESYAQSLGT